MLTIDPHNLFAAIILIGWEWNVRAQAPVWWQVGRFN